MLATSSMPKASQTPEPLTDTCMLVAIDVSNIASYADAKPVFDISKEYVLGTAQAVVKVILVNIENRVWVVAVIVDGCATTFCTVPL
jgi:hypothetical protein